MALEQKLRLKLAQRLVMTPSLQQAIKLLQLSRLELEEALSQEILENPVLDVEEIEEESISLDDNGEGSGVSDKAKEGSDAPSGTGDQEETPQPSSEDTYADIDVEAFFADYLNDSRVTGPSTTQSQEGDLPLENILTESPGLSDHLLWQLHLTSCPSHLYRVCEFIIGNIDEDGFLQASDEEIMDGAGVSLGDVHDALALVRSFDPPGVAARSLAECLTLQLDVLAQQSGIDEQELDMLAAAHKIISEFWDSLLHQRWDVIANAVGCTVAQLKPYLDVISSLEPKPGRVFRKERSVYIEPDVHVKKVDGEYKITLNDDGMPRLRLNSMYSRMLEGKELDPHVSNYLKEKMRNAMWLMKSIDQRQRTIFKVAHSIVTYQKDFLDHGIEHLRPMVLRQVADDIGMHESTISRVVSNKYMYTPRGLFPLKFFFHSGVDSARGENVSSLVVKERIRKLVEAEDSGRPLSDSKIMKLLQREGIRLARRTVAKYREELRIPSSDKRKKVF